MQYNLFITYIMLCIRSPDLVHLIAGSLYSLLTPPHFLPLPAPGTHHSTVSMSLTFWDFTCEIIQRLSFSVRLISLSITPFESVRVVAKGRISFFFNGRILFLWCVCVCVCVCVWHFLYPFIMDTWVVSTSCLLLILLQWIQEYQYLVEIMISFPWDKYSEMRLLENLVFLFLVSWGNFTLFSTAAVSIYILPGSTQVFPFPPLLTNTCYFVSLLIALRTGVRW